MHAENYIHLGKRIPQEADYIYIYTSLFKWVINTVS